MNLVLTIAMGDAYQKMASLTHPSIKKYAEKIGADFACISEQAISKTTPHWEKFQIYHYLEKYNRVLYIDTDIIIRDDCPNLFDIVPETKLGMFNEGNFTDRSKELMIDICKSYNTTLDSWDGHYYNSGVMVISQVHKKLFKKPELEVCNFYEQSYLNMMIAKWNIDMFELEHRFNRMTCMDRFTGEERFASYLIHYAGYPHLEGVLDLIPKDLQRWEDAKGNYQYRKHLYIAVTGGIGDQICAEPAIRFMRKNLYPDDEFVVATHEPRLFQHLVKDGVTVVKHGEAQLAPDTPYYITNTLPGPDTLQWAVVSHLLCHPVDYTAIALMHRTLPLEDKSIHFEITRKDYKTLRAKTGITDFSGYVLVHPGRHWNSKTFPAEYWQSIIDGLGEKVIVIGKTAPGDPPFYEAGARGTVDIDASKVIDMREKLSIGELAALMSKAKTLITNDSFPVHLAGATNIQIILIPSCKHPDHILPYRKGNPYYKAKAVYKRLFLDDVESRPTQVYETSASGENIDWDNYLLSVAEVLNSLKH